MFLWHNIRYLCIFLGLIKVCKRINNLIKLYHNKSKKGTRETNQLEPPVISKMRSTKVSKKCQRNELRVIVHVQVKGLCIWIICTVEPIFKDISNSDNCCYNDRFANPPFSLYLSHAVCFYNNECEKSLSFVITTTRSESLGVKWKKKRFKILHEKTISNTSSCSPLLTSIAWQLRSLSMV